MRSRPGDGSTSPGFESKIGLKSSPHSNWLLVRGLRRHGYGDVADTLAERSRDLAELSGFNEFYNPLTGEPVGAPEFGWATLAAVI